jgi:hypothetical protein
MHVSARFRQKPQQLNRFVDGDPTADTENYFFIGYHRKRAPQK